VLRLPLRAIGFAAESAVALQRWCSPESVRGCPSADSLRVQFDHSALRTTHYSSCRNAFARFRFTADNFRR